LESVVNKVLLVSLVFRDSPVPVDSLVRAANPESPVPLVMLEFPDNLVIEVSVVSLENVDPLVLSVNPVPVVFPVSPEMMVLKVLREKRDPPVFLDPKVCKEMLVIVVLLVPLELLVTVVTKDLKETLVLKV